MPGTCVPGITLKQVGSPLVNTQHNTQHNIATVDNNTISNYSNNHNHNTPSTVPKQP